MQTITLIDHTATGYRWEATPEPGQRYPRGCPTGTLVTSEAARLVRTLVARGHQVRVLGTGPGSSELVAAGGAR